MMLSSLSESSTYVDFKQAFANPGKEYHVVGKLDKSKETVYNPETNPDEFQFYLIDNNGESRKVILKKSKPHDFERSEQIVIIGKAEGENFVASNILLKCPSKYTDGQDKIYEKTAEK
ncbi:MAG: cytochrome c maturation protein CcmE [Bacteroidetes bacterium]|nr:MAG: cytochrome c maturation protein CcmE [Bacteroidota bacterium]